MYTARVCDYVHIEPIQTTPSSHLVLLLLGGRAILLVKSAVGDLEASEGLETEVEDSEEEEEDHKTVEDACNMLGKARV